jgi:hypothetical protein
MSGCTAGSLLGTFSSRAAILSTIDENVVAPISKLWMRESSAEGTLSYHIWGTWLHCGHFQGVIFISSFEGRSIGHHHWSDEPTYIWMNDNTNSHPNGCTHASKSWRLQLVFKVLWFSWLFHSKNIMEWVQNFWCFILRITKSAIDRQFKSHCFQLHKQFRPFDHKIGLVFTPG